MRFLFSCLVFTRIDLEKKMKDDGGSVFTDSSVWERKKYRELRMEMEGKVRKRWIERNEGKVNGRTKEKMEGH